MTIPQKRKFWFKRRRYGWGWMPSTWQGWAVIVVFVTVIITAAVSLMPPRPAHPTHAQMLTFLAVDGVAVAGLTLVLLLTGPLPRWRWGWKPGDNPDEDF